MRFSAALDKDFFASLPRRLWAFVPLGGSLPEHVWLSRHRFLSGLAWFHAVLIALIGPLKGYSWELSAGAFLRDGTVLHSTLEAFIVAFFAFVGSIDKLSRTARACAVSLGLISSSAIFVHLSGGYIELHFHFFVMLVFLALYHDWAPYLLAVAYVALHHGIVGTLWPQEVYNHAAALNAPWTWGGIHAFFIFFQSVGSIVLWRFSEKATTQNELLLNSVGEGICGVDGSGRITCANPVAERTLRAQPNELIGRPIDELLSPMKHEGGAPSLPPTLRPVSIPMEGRAMFRRRDNTSFPVEYVSNPIIERGELTGAVVSFKDITNRERVAEALRDSQRQYLDLIQSIDGIVWEADAVTFRFTFVSDDAERILGFPARTWIEEPHFWSDHIHPEDREWAMSFCAKATVEKRPHRFEYRMTAADGRVVWLGDIVSVVVENGRAVKLRGVMIDITQRREAEERARRNHDRIRTLHEITAAASSSLELDIVLEALMQKIVALLPYAAVQIWLKDIDTGNLERATCLNIDRDEWMGRELKSLPLLVRIAVESKIFVVSDNVQTDPRILDREFYRKQGVVAYLGIPFVVKEEVLGVLVLLTREPHEFFSEEIEYLTALASQVAMAINKSQLYAQIKSQAEELEKANKEICDFTAMIAHDLRSPLNNVMGVSELMTESAFGPVTDEQKKWLRKVGETVRQLVNLVNDFLDVSKLEAGNIDLHLEPIDISQLFDAVLSNYQFVAKDREIFLRKKIAATAQPLRGDKRRLEQVLSNLVGNALKFTPSAGEIELGADWGRSEVVLWVKDTGVGISSSEIGGLFQKYKQAASARSSEQKGTGLGLVICKMIVEAHGGKIWAESEEGKGAKFIFTLPCKKDEPSSQLLN